jgi:hypothetical protein
MSFKIKRGFRCTPERHMWSSGLELAVYHKIAAVTWVKPAFALGFHDHGPVVLGYLPEDFFAGRIYEWTSPISGRQLVSFWIFGQLPTRMTAER